MAHYTPEGGINTQMETTSCGRGHAKSPKQTLKGQTGTFPGLQQFTRIYTTRFIGLSLSVLTLAGQIYIVSLLGLSQRSLPYSIPPGEHGEYNDSNPRVTHTLITGERYAFPNNASHYRNMQCTQDLLLLLEVDQ